MADTLSNLGECALKAGRTDDATSFYERALEVEEEYFGADQPVLGSTLHCLGLCAEQVRVDVAMEQGLECRALVVQVSDMCSRRSWPSRELSGYSTPECFRVRQRQLAA